MNALYALVKADFLERVRRYSFLVTLAFAVYVGLAAARGQISLRLGEYVGVPNSAWVGGLMALTTTVFLSLVGFYIVSNSIHRDQLTRVGRILAATPMSRFSYMLAKAISNFAVLAAMVLILAIAGVGMVLFQGKQPLEWGPLLTPFLFIALPAMALVAAIAVFFEATPVLRRVSAFVYFFCWIFALANLTHGHFDPIGMQAISGSMMEALKAIDPHYEKAISFGFIAGDAGRSAYPKAFYWTGIAWTAQMILEHLALVPLAAVIALVPGVWFHRFDPASEFMRGLKKSKPAAAGVVDEARSVAGPMVQPAQLIVAGRAGSMFAAYVALIANELRLVVARRKWWFYVAAAGLMVAGFTVPLDGARHFLVAVIWILPMLLWSRLGAREDLFATRGLVFSAPRAALRPLIASWIAGACLPLVLVLGVLMRLAVGGDFGSAAALVVGAFFAVALALAVGNLARTPKAFEALYVVWWYMGPMQGIRGLDFAGVTVASAQPGLYAAISCGLIVLAWGVRELRLVRG